MAIILLLSAIPVSWASPDSSTQPLYILKMRPAQGSDSGQRTGQYSGETLERSPTMKLILNRVLNQKNTEPAAKTVHEIPLLELIPNPLPKPQLSEKKDFESNPNPVPNKSPFEILAADETLFLALRRWTTTNKVQLIWDAGKDFPARNTVYTAKDLHEAIEMVMADTERSNYPLHACTYANHVIRILHVSQACQRL